MSEMIYRNGVFPTCFFRVFPITRGLTPNKLHESRSSYAHSGLTESRLILLTADRYIRINLFVSIEAHKYHYFTIYSQYKSQYLKN